MSLVERPRRAPGGRFEEGATLTAGGAPKEPGPGGAGVGRVVVIGAGPAGLTAAYLLAKRGTRCTVLEADLVPGGIARTVERDGWRFDIGGHRFFTKVKDVEALWHEILGSDDLLVRPRLSRIYYGGRFFDYPIQIGNALCGLGLLESLRCALSFLWVKVHHPKHQNSYEGWVASRFGWRLYRKFFKSYTEKVWGIPATEVQADWAAQRIKTLSLSKALWNAVSPLRGRRRVTSLIEEFQYPRLGPGMMWERVCDLVTAGGSEVRFASAVKSLRRDAAGVVALVLEVHPEEELPVDHVICSMPLRELVLRLDPPAPGSVRSAAERLHYRDFLTVALIVPEEKGFPDNWIYVHDPTVKLGRIQNFGSWSPDMVKSGWTCLGLEYFVFENDALWQLADDALVKLATEELCTIGLAEVSDVACGYVVRMPKAYPVYDPGYEQQVRTIRSYLEQSVPNLYPVGRNGMHRYNNQDHSMVTAMLTVENLFGENYDTWAVNVEAEYHEEQVARRDNSRTCEGQTGRPAPSPTARA
ncbi:MAG: NAD(P)/FAD-dependent oxidoreductase [Acidimicrobiales bacterium]